MYRVYQEHVATGKVSYIGEFESKAEAAKKIAHCHKLDLEYCLAYGDYYYFIK